MTFAQKFEDFVHGFARWAGSSRGFAVAFASVFAWMVAGMCEHFSNEWVNAFCLYISCITFLMIFLMQRAQNKAVAAIQVQLNELISATQTADNQFINTEKRSEREIAEMKETHERAREAD